MRSDCHSGADGRIPPHETGHQFAHEGSSHDPQPSPSATHVPSLCTRKRKLPALAAGSGTAPEYTFAVGWHPSDGLHAGSPRHVHFPSASCEMCQHVALLSGLKRVDVACGADPSTPLEGRWGCASTFDPAAPHPWARRTNQVHLVNRLMSKGATSARTRCP